MRSTWTFFSLTWQEFSIWLVGRFMFHPRSLAASRSCLVFCFPNSSVGKESACNAESPGLIPRSGRSPGEGIGYPLQYSWASLVAQLVKNLPAMWETWVQSLGWKDPIEKGKATHSSILAWRIPWTIYDHYIYYGGQESLRRIGVAIIINKSPKCSTWIQS